MEKKMSNIEYVFLDIMKEKTSMTSTNSGIDFEECIRRCLRQRGFDFANVDEDRELKNYLSEIKPEVLNPLANSVLKNGLAAKGNRYTNIYIHQPYGSQQFPDFLVFTKDNVFCIESKYSKKNGNKPVWNSNLPKSSTIYIFGCYEKRDVTYFVGEDVLPQNERIILNKFFSETTTKLMDDFQHELYEKYENKEMNFEHGFNVYIRKAFDQSQVINPLADIDYFGSKNRKLCEENVVTFLHNAEINSLM